MVRLPTVAPVAHARQSPGAAAYARELPVKDNALEHVGGYGQMAGGALLFAGICIMGFTLYGTQRTTAQILLKQPAAVQNPKKGLMVGGAVSAAGIALLCVGSLLFFVGGKMHH